MNRTLCVLLLLAWSAVLLPRSALANPESGLWYDPDRSGNGLDLHRAGSVLFGAFYTYDVLHSPEWLWIQTTDSNAPSGTLTRYSRVQGRLTASVVGQFTLTPVDSCQSYLPQPTPRAWLRMDFTLDGQSHRWCMQPLLPAAQVAEVALSGAWYDPADPGWGLFAHHYPDASGRTHTFRTLYYLDSSTGAPRWAFAQDPLQSSSQLQTFYSSRVECSGCSASLPLTIPIGNARIQLSAPGASSRIEVALNFDGKPAFARSAALLLLSNRRSPPP